MQRYDTRLGYLQYSSTSDRLSIPMRLRERHLTEETRDVLLQAIGTCLQIAIWSSRENILLRIPLIRWCTSRVFSGRLSGANNGHLSIGRFEDYIDAAGDFIRAKVIVHDLTKP